jgi:hypothetical protein
MNRGGVPRSRKRPGIGHPPLSRSTKARKSRVCPGRVLRSSTVKVTAIRLSDADLAMLDRMRGDLDRSRFLRLLVRWAALLQDGELEDLDDLGAAPATPDEMAELRALSTD